MHGALQQYEMKAGSAQAESCCVYVKPEKLMQHMHGIISQLFDCWAYPVAHLLILKSSMVYGIPKCLMLNMQYSIFDYQADHPSTKIAPCQNQQILGQSYSTKELMPTTLGKVRHAVTVIQRTSKVKSQVRISLRDQPVKLTQCKININQPRYQ